MAKLSVVICVYNTDEIYFEECLKSVFNSSLKDIEVIIVDDGSTKDYSKLIKKFNDIKYIKTENQGTLAARILGVKTATAPYVCFVDSDDYMSFIYFDASIKKAMQTNADVIINDWAFNTEKTKYVCLRDSIINQTFELNGDAFFNKYFEQAGNEHSYYVLWNKIFKREHLISACEQIETLNLSKLVFAEDVLITYFVFLYSKKVINLHLGYYFYRIHSFQQVAVDSQKKLYLMIDSMTSVFDIIESNLKHNNIFDKYQKDFLKWKKLLCSVHFYEAKKYRDKNLFEYIKVKYKVNKLEKLPKDYGKTYIKHMILPDNIDEIDNQLKKIYYSNKHLKIYSKKSSYAYKFICEMKKLFGIRHSLVINKKQASILLKKEKISIKKRILHKEIIYKLGMFFFHKGSKLRQKLKSKL